MGLGPTVLLQRERLARVLEEDGFAVRVSVVEEPTEIEHEIRRTFEIDRRLARLVRAAKKGGRFPLVLAGNCNSSLGTTAGLETSELGVVWLDAHADFDVPDDNLSGFFDVMALSTLTGSCWAALRRTIGGFREIPEDRIVLAAVRDLERYQRQRLQRSRVTVVDAPRILDEGVRALAPALDHLGEVTSALYVHVDLDSLDPAQGRANEYAAPGGLSLRELQWVFELIQRRFRVLGAAVTAYNPAFDETRRMGQTAVEVVRELAGRFASPGDI